MILLNTKMKIIYLSGIDGCGKTTQAKLLVEHLKDKGIDAEYQWFRWEPSLRKLINIFRFKKTKPPSRSCANKVETENTEQSDWLRLKRRILSNSILKKAWIFYACRDYLAAYKKRFNHVTADIVVIDRYVDDFIIDQSVNLKIPADKTDILKDNFFLHKFQYPDLSIIIDLPAQEGYNRKNDGTPLSYLETREKYYRAMNGADTLHLDGLNSIDKLATQIAEWVAAKLEGMAK